MKNSKGMRITSYVLQSLIGIMFFLGALGNLFQTEMAKEQAMMLGYPEGSIFYLGLILLISTLLYVIPKTNILGAAFITAWLGGAVATHIIHQDPIANTVAPVIFGVIVWVSLWLRNDSLKKIFPTN